MTSDMSELRVWVDIFFNDQNAVDIVRELDKAEIVYRDAPNHIVIATEGVVKRAWCLLELLIRMMAGKQSAMMGISDESGTIRLIDYNGTNWNNLFEEMEAFSQDDKEKIKRRILLVCTATEFNDKIKDIALAFDYSISQSSCNLLVLAPFYLILAIFVVLGILILLIATILVLTCKAIFICFSKLKAACWHEEAESYKRLE
jgi:hypothetical protein